VKLQFHGVERIELGPHHWVSVTLWDLLDDDGKTPLFTGRREEIGRYLVILRWKREQTRLGLSTYDGRHEGPDPAAAIRMREVWKRRREAGR
jgi:hypothetical protein